MKIFLQRPGNFIRNTRPALSESGPRQQGLHAQDRSSFSVVLAGLLCVLIFAAGIGLCACGSKDSGYDGPVYERLGTGSDSTAVSSDEGDTSVSDGDGNQSADTLYMIESFESAEGHIILRDLTTRRLYRYSYGDKTNFLSKFGGKAQLSDFHPGSVVTIGALDSDHKLKEIRFSDKAFVMENVTNYSMDQGRNIFTIGQTNYEMNDETEIFSGDILSDASALTENDTLRVVGIDKKIISLSVTNGHGYLYVTDTDTFTDSLMQIGDRTFVKVTGETMTVEVPEGTYEVTVAKGGYGGSAQVTVARGETVSLSLDDLKGEGPKSCEITFSIGVEGAHIYLDGSEVKSDTPMSVQYGQHSLKVTAEGYNEWSRTLVVNSPTAKISLDISDEKKTSSGETNDAASSSSSANASTNTGGSTNSSANGTTGTGSTGSSSTSGNSTNGTANSSGSTAASGTDLNGDGVYDEKDAQLQYLSTISNMLSTLSSNNSN